MIDWWWLIVEAIVILVPLAGFRGRARAVGLADGLNDPPAARVELWRRGYQRMMRNV
jgi:hypothetical protein